MGACSKHNFKDKDFPIVDPVLEMQYYMKYITHMWTKTIWMQLNK